MARLVLGAAGAFVGSLVGGPVGAQVGWALGSLVGGAFEPSQRTYGPRLSDLKVMTSSWGQMVPMVYGQARLAGDILWSTDLVETTTTTRQGGKGGPSVKSTTYSYSVDFACMICEGPIDGVLKIFANGQLIFNYTAGADAETIIASSEFAKNIRFYPGDESQLPDPLIEAHLGVGNVPAYRGIAYIVFEGFQLEKFGNRLPNMEYLVTKSGTRNLALVGTTEAPGNVGLAWNSSGQLIEETSIWFFRGDWGPDGPRPYQVQVDNVSFDGKVNYSTVAFLAGTGVALAAMLHSNINGAAFHQYSAQEITWINYEGAQFSWTYPTPGMLGGDEGIAVSRIGENTVVSSNIFGSPILKYTGIGGDPAITVAGVGGKQIPAIQIFDGKVYALSRTATEISIERYALSSMTLEHSFDIAPLAMVRAFTVVGHDEFYAVIGTTLYRIWDGGEEVVGTISEFISGSTMEMNYLNGMFYITGSIPASGGGQKFVMNVYAKTIVAHPVNLSDIVTDQCLRSGLDAGEIDVSELTDSVHGYKLATIAPARQNIAQLQKAFYFDAVESMGKIAFRKRGRAPVVTIPWDELAAHADGASLPEALSVVHGNETELPRTVNVSFLNANSDLQPGTESSQRMITSALATVEEAFGISMSPDKAAQIAEVLLYDHHVAANTFQFALQRKYTTLEPTDVVTIPTPSASYRLRLVDKKESAGVIDFTAVADDATIYNSTAQGASQMESQVQVTLHQPTTAVYLDIPILREQDDDAGFYVAMTSSRNSWRGATLFRSMGDPAYNEVDTVLHHGTIGRTIGALGDWTGGNIIDTSNYVDVRMVWGELESITVEQLLNERNAAAIGAEIICFLRAEMVSDGVYRLSGLLRGQKGTEQHIGSHQSNEHFVLFTDAGTLRPNEGTVALGQPRRYKPVTIGRSIEQTAEEDFTNHGNGLKPLSVVLVRGGVENGDIKISWTRRTRMASAWRGGVDVPLGEEAEQYLVEILDDGQPVRLLGAQTPTVTYTQTMQIEDFGSPQTSVDVLIHQMSAAVGRGFPTYATVGA